MPRDTRQDTPIGRRSAPTLESRAGRHPHATRRYTAGTTHLLADDGHRGEKSLDLVVADQTLVVGVAELVNHGVSHAQLLSSTSTRRGENRSFTRR